MNAVAAFPPVVTIDLPYEGPSARDARCWVRGVLTGLVDEETIEAVVVCVSELVTNSQRHTRPTVDRKEITCRLRINTAGTVQIRGEVIDAGSPGKAPKSRQVNAEDEAGRGLSQVVNGYADGWGYEHRAPHEYMTWFQIHYGTGWDRAQQEMPTRQRRDWLCLNRVRVVDWLRRIWSNRRFQGRQSRSRHLGGDEPAGWPANCRSTLDCPRGNSPMADDTARAVDASWTDGAIGISVPVIDVRDRKHLMEDT